jgi:AraC-like DNA-binding protein
MPQRSAVRRSRRYASIAISNIGGHRDRPLEITRGTLSESDTLHIGLFESHPTSDACGGIERQNAHVVVLPFSGLFAKHEAPGRHVLGTPSNAVLIAANTPYRLSFPGAIGDRALVLRFDEALAPDETDGGNKTLASNGLLPAQAMMLRNLLWTRLEKHESDRFESEALGLDLLAMSLTSMRQEKPPSRRPAQARRARALERVKEAIAVAPAAKWNITRLSRVANLSPFHLCHVFREMVGTSIYNYVLHERLAATLDAVLDDDGDLTTIALDAGFASHSHFTTRFRSFFGCTPAALRRTASARRLGEIRKIMTARRSQTAY